VVGTVEPKRTRSGVTVKRGVARTQKWLLRKVPVSIYVTKSTPAQAIVDAMKLKYQVPFDFSPTNMVLRLTSRMQEEVSYEAARLAKICHSGGLDRRAATAVLVATRIPRTTISCQPYCLHSAVCQRTNLQFSACPSVHSPRQRHSHISVALWRLMAPIYEAHSSIPFYSRSGLTLKIALCRLRRHLWSHRLNPLGGGSSGTFARLSQSSISQLRR